MLHESLNVELYTASGLLYVMWGILHPYNQLLRFVTLGEIVEMLCRVAPRYQALHNGQMSTFSLAFSTSSWSRFFSCQMSTWSHVGSSPVPMGRACGPSWSHLGPALASPGACLATLGGYLGPSRSYIGFILAVFGFIGSHQPPF